MQKRKLRLTFEQAKDNLKKRQPHLTLLTYNGSKEKCKAIDNIYGEFEGTYKCLLNGRNIHKSRRKEKCRESALSKSTQEKRKKTCLEKYGVEHALQLKEILKKVQDTNLEKYGHSCSLRNKKVKEKVWKTKIKTGTFYNIDGYCGVDYYKNVGINTSLSYLYYNKNKVDLDFAINFERGSTGIEQIIKAILEKNNVNYILDQSLEGVNKRPDFVIKNQNLIIECDGLYWHSDHPDCRDEIKNNNKFHKERQELFKLHGYESLFFREDEIFNKTKIVESIVLAKLGLITNRIFARKTTIKEIDSKTSSKFFEENHLMGRGKGKTFALYYNNEIVSAIRVINKKDHIDISRFCNKLNTSVAGGLSKLLKNVINNVGKKPIVSFVDMRYGNGYSLKSLGFKEINNDVSFKWTNGKETYHRLKFKNNSGYELEYRKIWDCGQKKFELKL